MNLPLGFVNAMADVAVILISDVYPLNEIAIFAFERSPRSKLV